MKKFLEQLSAIKGIYEETPTVSEADRKFKLLHDKYSQAIGRRALYKSKSHREMRVVTIKQVYSKFLIVEYKYYSTEYEGSLTLTVNFSSLLCGDDSLELE